MQGPVEAPPRRRGGAAGSGAEPAGRRTGRAAGLGRAARHLFAPVDAASVAVFRIAFGIIMAWEVCRYFLFGWISEYFIKPSFYFTFYGFGWVRPWPGGLMYVHFAVLGVLALFVAAGFLYRASITLFFLGFTYVFLLDQTNYLNHFYLISLVSFLMIFVPANRAWSVDRAIMQRLRGRGEILPRWALWTLRAQIGIIYVYGGIAKLNADWLRGEPMGLWLEDASWYFSSDLVLDFLLWEYSPFLFSYGGLFFDLFVVPFLLWRRTRPFAFAALVAFHLTNSQIFSIGIFPMLGIATALIFFDPDWPRRLACWLRRAPVRLVDPRAETARPIGATGAPGRWRYAVAGLLGLYFAVQLLVPFRHHLYPGNVSWTEEGHNFAWHMKLRDKVAEARVFVTDPETGREWEIEVRDYLSERQARQMGERPDMMLLFAHHVRDALEMRGVAGAEVRIRSEVSLNGREPQPLVDPTVDLAAQERRPPPADYIMPLTEPLWGEGGRASVYGGR